jgi:hypothetical protein
MSNRRVVLVMVTVTVTGGNCTGTFDAMVLAQELEALYGIMI